MISMMSVLEKMGRIHGGYDDDGAFHSWPVFR